MKKQRLLATGLVVFAALVVFGQLPPPTLPSRPAKIPYVKSAGNIDVGEFRKFRFAGKNYCAVLLHKDIKSSPEWTPSSALPLSLGGVEAAASAELKKLVNDPAEWEITNIQLSRFSDDNDRRWYYVVTFNPMLRLGGIVPDDILVMLTLDGKPGRVSELHTR
jgi:hypothetical protein